MKTAIVVLGDPQSGSQESLGRVFNALASAYEFRQHGDDVQILFQGTGTRWVHELSKPDHPAHGLFESVRDTVAGASCGCADVFGASGDVQRSGFALVAENAVPGTSGLPSLRRLVADGYHVLTF
jgi:hypothetical protein